MMRIVVGFDPSKAQAAIAELREELAPGVEWRVLNLGQNPNGAAPSRSLAAGEGTGAAANLLQRLVGWLGKGSAQSRRQERKPLSGQLPENDALELTDEELAYLRHAPARSGTVLLVTAPDLHATEVRMWALRHGGFDLAPAPAGAQQV